MPGDSGGQRSPAGYSPWGCIQLDMTWWLNNNNHKSGPRWLLGTQRCRTTVPDLKEPQSSRGERANTHSFNQKTFMECLPWTKLGLSDAKETEKKKKKNASECFLSFKGSDNPRRMPIMKVKMTVWCKCLRAWTLGPGYLGSNPSSATH